MATEYLRPTDKIFYTNVEYVDCQDTNPKSLSYASRAALPWATTQSRSWTLWLPWCSVIRTAAVVGWQRDPSSWSGKQKNQPVDPQNDRRIYYADRPSGVPRNDFNYAIDRSRRRYSTEADAHDEPRLNDWTR